MATTAMTVAQTPAKPLPIFATGLPVIGTIDLNQPSEWAWWGAVILDLFMFHGVSKWVIAAGIITTRYEVQKGNWLNFT